MIRIALLAAAMAITVVTGMLIDWFARTTSQDAPGPPRTSAAAYTDNAIVPLEPAAGLDPLKVELGRRLFHEKRLSHDDSLSCASCHALDQGGVDRRRFSIGIDGAVGAVNAPTVLNSMHNFRQFWDGRSASLEEQAGGPVLNLQEMGSTWEEVRGKLAGDPGYVAAFARSYPDGIASSSISDAIATFERSLITSGSRFDRFLRGEAGAISDGEKAGYGLFVSLGCISCHQGANVGGNLYQRFGIMGDYFADRGTMTDADLGRYNLTHREDDRHVFKVPGLRVAALTPPYFHDGSAKSLNKAVSVMARYQLGTELTSDQIGLIVQFLTCLSDGATGLTP